MIQMANTEVTRTPAAAGHTIGQLIVQNRKALASVLPRHMDVDRLARLALTQCRSNTALLKADPASLVGALLHAAKLGLEPGVAGQGDLIPRWDKKQGAFVVQFQPGYRGLMDLARRSREVGSITAEVVREGDYFDYQYGTDQYLHHKPALGHRGDITHIYAVAHLHVAEDWQFTVLTVSDVDKVRQTSQAANNGPWVSHWEEMAKKTALRKLCKYLPMSIELQTAVTLDEMADAGVAQQNEALLPDDWLDVTEQATVESPADAEKE